MNVAVRGCHYDEFIIQLFVISDKFPCNPTLTMADNDVDVNEELLDYEDEPTEAAEAGAENGAATKQVRVVLTI